MLAAEYTTPIQGKPYYRSEGIIKAIDRKDNQYNVAGIAFERFDDQNFQYVFSPYWGQIENLPSDIFSGIPGIDMSIPKEHYYRVNMTPSFISKRTPSENRADLQDLLSEVGLDYYDRFEWLLRTNKRCGDDNLIVVRKRSKTLTFHHPKEKDINNFQPGDQVVLNKLCDISSNSKTASESVFRLYQSGVSIYIKEDDMTLTFDVCKKNLYSLRHLLEYEKRFRQMRQMEGISQAKSQGKYKGRKKITIDPLLFSDTVERFRRGIITEEQAITTLGISRSTFYRRIKENK